MTIDTLITLCVLAWVFPSFGLLRYCIEQRSDERRWLVFVAAFGWPLYLPPLLVLVFFLLTVNGVWEVL